MGRHTWRLPHIAGVRLPFTFNAVTSTGAAPTNVAQSAGNALGRTIVWNWHIPHEHWHKGKVPQFLKDLFGTESDILETDYRKRHRHPHAGRWWWCLQHVPTTTTGTVTNQVAVNKETDPITIYNLTAETLATHAWVRLDLARPEPNKWYTLAEVEFYESTEDAGSCRLRIEALVSGSVSNSIATTTTMTGGSWQSATLTGGYDEYENLAHGTQISIGAITYTFVTGAFSGTYQVAIGQSGGTTLDNLQQAINAGSGAGSLYSTGTSAHPQVIASVTDGHADASLLLTAVSGIRDSVANAITLTSSGALGVSGNAYFHGATLTGGVDGTYYSDPGFSFTSIVSAINQGSQGLEVQISNETVEVFLPDIREGRWDKAVATVQVVNWEQPTHGCITLFGGRIGKTTYDDTGFITIEIDNQMSRKRRWPSESWSPTCRAQLGDARCKFDIESMSKVATISAVVSQTEIRSLDVNAPPGHWQNGIIQVLDGLNAGQAVELLYSDPEVPTGSGANNALVHAKGWIESKITRKKKHKHGHKRKKKEKITYYNPDDSSHITLGGKVYTFKKTLVTGDGYVKIAGKAGKGCSKDDQSNTLEHLRDAMLLVASGAGSTYSSGTTAHTTILGGDVEKERFEFRAKIAGASGNALAITYSGGTHFSRSGATLEGGKGTPPATGAGASGTDYDTLTLVQAFPFPLTVGTHFKIWPGCQKRFVKDCSERYHNTVNFRGEPFAPTDEGLKVQ